MAVDGRVLIGVFFPMPFISRKGVRAANAGTGRIVDATSALPDNTVFFPPRPGLPSGIQEWVSARDRAPRHIGTIIATRHSTPARKNEAPTHSHSRKTSGRRLRSAMNRV